MQNISPVNGLLFIAVHELNDVIIRADLLVYVIAICAAGLIIVYDLMLIFINHLFMYAFPLVLRLSGFNCNLYTI